MALQFHVQKKMPKKVSVYEMNRIFDSETFSITINITAMKKQHSNRNILIGIVFCALAVTAMAFQDSAKINKQQQAKLDTVPKNNNIDIEIDMKDVDETIKKSFEQAQKSLKEIDWTKMSKQIEQSMKQIDMAKLQMEIDKSMKAVDWDKMKDEINRSMKEIDMSKMKFDMDKMRDEIKLSLKEINTEEIKKSMEELKKINFDDLKKEMDKVKVEMELNKDHFKIDMEKFKVDMEKVKAGMGELKEMLSEMEKDGLINKTEGNTIEYKDKELLINGKKQPQGVSEKYKKYFKGDSKFKFSDKN